MLRSDVQTGTSTAKTCMRTQHCTDSFSGTVQHCKLAYAWWQAGERSQVCQRRCEQAGRQAASHPQLQLRAQTIEQQLKRLGCIMLISPRQHAAVVISGCKE